MTATTELPTLGPALTRLTGVDPRSDATHRLVLASLDDVDRAYWIDTRSTASTYTFAGVAAHDRAADPIRVARAFTAYQHHTLVQQVHERAGDRDLVVVPCVDALYADDDVPSAEGEALFSDTLAVLDALADRGVSVLVTTATDVFSDCVADRVERTVAARRTGFGIAFETESFQTTVYRGPDFWQTTIPYWVELFGIEEPTPIEVAQPTLAALG